MNVTKRCRYGEMTYRVNDLFIGRSFDLYGEFSEGEVELFRHLVRPGQTVLDVGANLGAHTVPLAQMVGPGGRVLAFEPQRTVYYLLCANVVHNNLEGTVHCYHAAVGEARGAIAVPELSPEAVQNFGGLSLANSAWSEGDKVPVLRIDDLGLTACDLIKVDVEGMEREVLAGASETIRRFRPLLYVEDDRQEKSAALRSLLSSLGYDFYWHAPRLFNPNNFFNNSHNAFDNIASVNLYAYHAQTPSPIKPESFGMQRLSASCPSDEIAARPDEIAARPDEIAARPAPAGLAVGVSAVAPVDPVSADAGVPAPAQEALNMGLALYEQGRLDEAMGAFQRAADIKPDLAEAYNNIGLVDAAQGRYQEAIAAYRRAIALKPTFAEAHNNLALPLRQTGQLDAAIASCREATRVAPESPQAHSNLGCFLQEAERFDEAIEALSAALRVDPRFPQALNNLGICQWRLGRYEEASASYRRAIELAPDGHEAYNNLGSALRDQGELDEALACYDRAIEIRPDYAAPHWNRSLIWLLKGDPARGWPEYEWRWGLNTFQRRHYPQPAWDGSSPEGKTIFLVAEQGLGDTLQFIRYAPLLAARGARVVAEVHRPLRRLIKSCPGVDKVIVQGETPPPFDTHTTLMSLPGLFNTTAENIPAQVPYLAADARLVEQWRDEIKALPGFKIGIAWKGSPQNGQDRERSLPLVMFEQLASVPDVTLVSLQKGVGSEQIAHVADRFAVVDFGPRLDEMSGPFMDTAAVMAHLDLVVVCDSALAHLAGAMGVPVWLALMKTPDWRWLLEGETSRWYPTMRLFRQQRRGDWEGVFRQMAAVLANQVSGSALLPSA
jgi:FkbM family methyltransferase